MKKLALAVSLAAGLALQPVAHAGVNSNSSVSVSTTGYYAYGGLHDARFNSGSTEYINCTLRGTVSTYTSTTTSNFIQCIGRNTAGAMYYCYAYNPPTTWVDIVSSLNESSSLYFRGDASHHCLHIEVTNASYYL